MSIHLKGHTQGWLTFKISSCPNVGIYGPLVSFYTRQGMPLPGMALLKKLFLALQLPSKTIFPLVKSICVLKNCSKVAVLPNFTLKMVTDVLQFLLLNIFCIASLRGLLHHQPQEMQAVCGTPLGRGDKLTSFLQECSDSFNDDRVNGVWDL